MLETKIFEKLKTAYECSTLNNNLFEKAIKSIKWESTFYADGEYYFNIGNMSFTTQTLNPFQMDWKPSAIFSDGSYMEF